MEPARATLQGVAEAGPLRMKGEVGVESDGMIRTDLTISGSPGVMLEGLTMDIPIKAEHARYLYHYPEKWFSAANAGALPANGWSYAFKPLVWLGDEDRGFCWFAESDEHWRPTGNDKATQVLPQGETVVLRLNIIAAPVSLDKPLQLTFGYEATPVKEVIKDVWDYRICMEGNYDETKLDRLAKLGVRTIIYSGWTDIESYTSTTRGEELHRLVKACHERGMQMLITFGYLMSDLAPEYSTYADECLVEPRPGGYTPDWQPKQTAYEVCYASHWADFIASGMARLMDEYDVDGFFLDGIFDPWPEGCANPHHGCGYDAEDGTRRVTWPFFAHRRLMQRMWNIVKSRKPDGQVNVHNSGEMLIPTLVFATSGYDGEQLASTARGPDVFSQIPLETFRAEFMGRQWGVPAEFLCYEEPYTYEEALSFTLLHDVLVRGTEEGDGQGRSRIELESALWHVMDEFGRKQAQWLPYWSNQDVVQVVPETSKASIYNRGALGAMLIVSNLGRKQAEVTVTLNRAGLGLPARSTARDALSGEKLPWDGAALRTRLPAFGFRVVRVTPE